MLALAACAACAGRPAADDQGFHFAVQAARADAEVTFHAQVRNEPAATRGHERMILGAETGEELELDHNTELAPWVPAHRGDRLVVHGRLYVDRGRIGVHCTHSHTSAGCPEPGWVELGQAFYE